jgi:hypothetical protein
VGSNLTDGLGGKYIMYSQSDSWLNNKTNDKYVKELRSLLARNDIPVFIFLGAGLSFGVDRGRKEIEGREIEIEFEFSEQDDEDRFHRGRNSSIE